jgi:hypothetical protein
MNDAGIFAKGCAIHFDVSWMTQATIASTQSIPLQRVWMKIVREDG